MCQTKVVYVMGSTMYVINTSYVSLFIQLIKLELSFMYKRCFTGQMCITIKFNCHTLSAHCRIPCHSYLLSLTLDTKQMFFEELDSRLCINLHSLPIYVVLPLKMALEIRNVSYFVQKC